MKPEAVAIRLPRLNVGPEEILAHTPFPVVIFAEQGMVGANLADYALPESARPPTLAQASSLLFEIEEIDIIMDRSGSMKDPISSNDAQQKLAHVKEQMGKLGMDLFPHAKLRLFALNHETHEIPLDGKQELSDLLAKIGELNPDGQTSFINGFRLIAEEPARIPTAPSTSKAQARKVMIFVTDGLDDARSRMLIAETAEKIRDQNVGTFIIGVGSDYDLPNLVDIAGYLGFAGWAHTPMPGNENVFNFHLPAFLAEIQSSEHYLEIKASGNISKFYGLTPSIREARNGVFYIGYQNQGVGICFVGNDDPTLTLSVKQFRADEHGVETEIPLIDFEDAAAYFEKREWAKNAIGPLLVFMAQLDGDKELLMKLRDEYKDLIEPIDQLIATIGEPDAAARMTSHGATSTVGSMTQAGFIGRRRGQQVNAFSYVPGSTNPPRTSVGQSQSGLHSGGLGPMDQPPGAVPPLGTPNPDAYKSVVPVGHPKLVIRFSNAITEYDLFEIPDGKSIVVGNESSCQIALTGDTQVSRHHLQIRRAADKFYIKDLGSEAGSLVNGKRITTEVCLESGDILTVGGTYMTFRA